MRNLRSMIDGVGSLTLGVTPAKPSKKFSIRQDVIIRRATNRSGPTTNEVMVGTILAMNGDTAKVSIMRAGGVTEQKDVKIKDLLPVTQGFKNQTIQLSPNHRGRV